MGDFDFLSDTPTPADILRAQALALRKQNDPSALKQQADQGMLLSAAHNSGLQNMGQRMVANSQDMSGETSPRLLGMLKASQEGPQADLGGKTPETFKLLTQRDMVPKFASDIFGRYNVRTGQGVDTPGSGIDSLLSPEAIEQHAQLYNATGKLPQMGKANPIVHGAILKRAAELLGTGNSLAANQANNAADKGSLATLRKSADSIEAFENTALANLDQLDKAAQGVVDSGLPILNKPLRSLDNRILGDPKMSAFNVARQTAVQEVGKVLGGAVAGGAITDSQRHEVEGLLSPDMTLAQIRAGIAQIKKDMANRKSAVQAQLGSIQGRLGGKTTTDAAPAPAAASTETVDVISPEGVAGKIPAAKLAAALQRGFKRAGQ